MSEFREGKALIAASRPFTVEKKALSWFHVLSTLAVIAVLLTAAVMAPFWPLQLVASILAGLTIVRGFILYHDFHHGALLKNDVVARAIFNFYGLLVLTPPRVWRQTHNYHHANNAKIVGSHVGSYPMMTVEMWKKATPAQRRFYRIARHPLTILFGYVFIFQYGMCVSGFLRRPEKNWDSALALVLHFAIIGVVGYYFGLNVLFFGVILPLMVACCTGAYLFYAQHNFEGMHLQPRENWSYTRAAIESSSYMKTGVFWGWMTGNIGYHHVHHLNPGIPFYRLPEAHEAIPELQQAKTTSLWPRDISACFRLKIWDPEKQQMVGYPS
jgi:omega-6 fatty acid desaturase (delta-12 desaturase)